MWFGVLGPVTILGPGPAVAGGMRPQQRALLAALLVDVDHVVPRDQLLYRVWGEHPPPQAGRTLHTHVSRIRKVLAALPRTGPVAVASLFRHDGGYRLATDPLHVDAVRFEALAGSAARVHDLDHRRVLLEEARTLWRGEALAGVTGQWAAHRRSRFRHRHLAVTLDWAETMRALGHGAATVDPLTELSERHPLSEPLVAALVRALYATGHRVEAVHRYQRLESELVAATGVRPGHELRLLHEVVLRGEPLGPEPVGALPRL
ncbi:AfsR/SARP family transcriptional regulator [Actinoalloteichus caeruleus]|uniref:AfsR/SARP family transcriptional regulator n=1 Tax=Actinoalloteichus cyanogriseus TaxID=2893586 RepID=UPI0004AB8336|nr:BTAD domain-containing putative transcriptional regulator [Actinoalloteichus caeruleus]